MPELLILKPQGNGMAFAAMAVLTLELDFSFESSSAYCEALGLG